MFHAAMANGGSNELSGGTVVPPSVVQQKGPHHHHHRSHPITNNNQHPSSGHHHHHHLPHHHPSAGGVNSTSSAPSSTVAAVATNAAAAALMGHYPAPLGGTLMDAAAFAAHHPAAAIPLPTHWTCKHSKHFLITSRAASSWSSVSLLLLFLFHRIQRAQAVCPHALLAPPGRNCLQLPLVAIYCSGL